MIRQIMAHSHVLLHPYNETSWNDQVLKEALALRVARGVNHARDTLMAGDGLCRAEVVRQIVSEGPALVRELIEFGVRIFYERGGGGRV